MKKDIHPKYYEQAKVICACGNTWTTGSTQEVIHTEMCSVCHPFFTGEQRIVDTAGQVDRFQKRKERADKLAAQRAGIKAGKEKQEQAIFEFVPEDKSKAAPEPVAAVSAATPAVEQAAPVVEQVAEVVEQAAPVAEPALVAEAAPVEAKPKRAPRAKKVTAEKAPEPAAEPPRADGAEAAPAAAKPKKAAAKKAAEPAAEPAEPKKAPRARKPKAEAAAE